MLVSISKISNFAETKKKKKYLVSAKKNKSFRFFLNACWEQHKTKNVENRRLKTI